MGSAYAYCVGEADPPDEWVLLGYLDRFGAEATYGRQIGAGEMRRMVIVENVISAYRESKNTSSLAEWIKHNHDKYRLLGEASEIWQMLKLQ